MTTINVTLPRTRRALGLLASLSPLLLLTLLFWPAAVAQATNNVVVGDGLHASSCNMINLGTAMNNNTDASITFACGGPATISLTQANGLNVVNGKRFTISGSDSITLTGLDGNRLFWVQTGGALTLTHILLVHGHDSAGGAIRNDSGAYLALDHATLRGNQSVNSGGAVFNSGGGMRVSNSLFESNQASDGGAIFSQGSLTVTNSNFRNNAASLTGGALYVIGSAALSAGQVFSNAAGQQGGGLDVNTGAVVTVDQVVFDRNHTLTTTVSLLYNGGAIHSAGTLTVTNSSFTHNASVYGGGLFNYADALYLSNDVLSGNVAAADGGALSNLAGGTVRVHDSTLSLNIAANGGALHNDYAASDLQLFHTAVLANMAGVLGGGIYGEQGIVALYDQSSLTGNTAQAGGGLYAKAGSNFSLFDSSVESNHATNQNGGGLYIETGAVGGLSNVSLQGNHAEGSGGAIDNEANSFSVLGSALTRNTAIYGAGLYNTGKNVTLGASTVQGNTGSYGVGVENDLGGGIDVNQTTIAGNAGIIGGGLKNEAGGNIQVFQSTIAANTAEYGAGVSNDVSGTLYLENSTLSGNTASVYGGGLDTAGDVTLLNATVSNNRAVTGGGLNIEAGARAVLTNTILAYSLDGGNCVGAIAADRHSLSSDNTCGFSGMINGHAPNHLDPLLTALGHYGGLTPVHMLKHNSPALDALDSSNEPGTDQRGFPRPKGLGFEPGAVERQPPPVDSDLAPWLWLPMMRR